MLKRATPPANGERLECIAFTDPLEAAVVAVDQMTELVIPSIAELDGATVDGRAIKVNIAKPREERPASNNRSFAGSKW